MINNRQPTTSHLINAVQQKAIVMTEQYHEVEKLYERSQHQKRVWDDLLLFLEKDWPCHILKLINLERQILVEEDKKIEETKLLVNEIFRTANAQTEILKKRYPAFIEEACRNENLTIDRGSHHPKYTFFEGFFKLQIDDRKCIAQLFDYEGKLAEFPADIGAAVESIQREYKRIFERPFNGEKFIQRLRNQYLAIIDKEKLTDGAEIPIRKISRRLTQNIEGFRSDEFLIDLSRLAEKGPTEIDGRRLYLQQTKDTARGMLLFTKGGGYVGYVVFKKE